MRNWLICLALAAYGALAFGQASTDDGAEKAPEKAPAKPAVKPAAKKPKAPKKAPKAEKSAEKEPEKPKDAPPVTETTLIEPSLIYRAGKLAPRAGSVYHRKDHGDFFDQTYFTLLFKRTYDYTHTVVIEPGFRTMRENPQKWDTTHFMEQAYVESSLTQKLSFTAGKRTEYEGSGFIVNPSDLINEDKDILDQVYQKEGVVFTRLRYRLPAELSLGLGFIPRAGSPTTAGRGLLQLSGEVKQVEIRLNMTAHETDKTTTGFSVQRFFGEHFELHVDGRYQARQRATDGQNGYLAYSQYKGKDGRKDDPSGFYLAGARYILTPRRTLVFEAIQQQSGLLPAEFEQLYAAQRASNERTEPPNPPTKLLGRHYVFSSYQDDQTLSATHLSANALVNTDDKSQFIILSARYAISPITSLEFSPTYFRGVPNTEFGEEPFAQAYYMIFRGRF